MDRRRAALAWLPAVLLAGCSSGPSGPETVGVNAELVVSPAGGTALTDFLLDASGSTAQTRGELEFRWDWDGDGEWDTGWGAGALATRRFGDSEAVSVRVQARQDGFTDVATAPLSVNLQHGQQAGELRVQELIEPRDLTWDGSQFWILGEGAGGGVRFSRVDLAGQVGLSHPALLSQSNGIAWDGEHLWITDNTVESGEQTLLFQVDPATGANLWSFEVAYSNRPSGLDYRDGVFYQGSTEGNTAGDDRIHGYDREGDELLALDVPAGTESPRALAADGEDLWVIAYGSETIYVLDAETGAVERSLEIPGHLGVLAVVNDHLWLPFIEWEDDEERLFLRKFVP